MKACGETKKAFRYRLDRRVRAVVMWVMAWMAPETSERQLDLRRENVERILLVRSLFRIGDSILATPAIFLLTFPVPERRKFNTPSVLQFPHSTISDSALAPEQLAPANVARGFHA